MGARHRTGLALLAAPMFMVVMGCASSTPAASWPDAQAPGESPLLPQGEHEDDLEQTGEAGRLREPKSEPLVHRGELLRGRATVLVNAPPTRVRDQILALDEYAEFMPHYKSARTLVRKPNGAREIYMQWEALHGAVKLWARMILTPTEDGDAEIWTTEFVDGNVDEAFAAWRIEPAEDGKTTLTLETFLDPKLPVPQSLLNEENVAAAIKAVKAMRDRCERPSPSSPD
ncbi:MAG TPA: SRPBCC family protein [Polyangiaceae bacterium]|nr:SRPBCC family protein [Polyangiaceae bacterium]